MLKWEGPFHAWMVRVKNWLSHADQAKLLAGRGLLISDLQECEARLSQVNYYRWSGYFRYFQVAPHAGDNSFVPGTTFDEIWEIYSVDAHLRSALVPLLESPEVLLRASYAYVVGQKTAPTGLYLDDAYFSGTPNSESLSAACRKDLDRSRERFILRYKDVSQADPHASLPVWSAVESFSFGTLSKCIQRADQGTLKDEVADVIGVPRDGFDTRVRALVYLRNRCAHHARLWRHSVIDAGRTPNNVRKKVKKQVGQFHPRSVMDVLASLDDLLHRKFIEGGAVAFVTDRPRRDTFLDGLLKPRAHRDGSSA